MANSKDRRKLRRMLQEAGLGKLLLPPSPPSRKSLWKRVPRWIYGLIGILALLITLLEGYPYLSIQENGFINAKNPFSEMFQVRNGGYIPLENLVTTCSPSLNSPSPDNTMELRFIDNEITIPTADFLAHDGVVTLPCFNMLRFRGRNIPMPTGSKLRITVTYSFWHLNYLKFRRSQTFHFRSIQGEDKQQHWEFLN